MKKWLNSTIFQWLNIILIWVSFNIKFPNPNFSKYFWNDYLQIKQVHEDLEMQSYISWLDWLWLTLTDFDWLWLTLTDLFHRLMGFLPLESTPLSTMLTYLLTYIRTEQNLEMLTHLKIPNSFEMTICKSKYHQIPPRPLKYWNFQIFDSIWHTKFRVLAHNLLPSLNHTSTCQYALASLGSLNKPTTTKILHTYFEKDRDQSWCWH